MSVIGGVLLFSAGLMVGGGAVAYNRACVRKAEQKSETERDGLRREVYDVKFRAECDRAYREGYAEGRKNPLSDIAVAPLQRFAGATSPRRNPRDSRGAAGACRKGNGSGA